MSFQPGSIVAYFTKGKNFAGEREVGVAGTGTVQNIVASKT